jgi:hypothetical protein
MEPGAVEGIGGGGRAVGLTDLSDDELIIVLQLLDPGSLSALERASSRCWRLSANTLGKQWKVNVARVYGVLSLEEASALTQVPEIQSFREAYGLLWMWGGRYASHDGPASLISRAITSVRMIRDNMPLRPIVKTLKLAWNGLGATEQELDALVSLHPPVDLIPLVTRLLRITSSTDRTVPTVCCDV